MTENSPETCENLSEIASSAAHALNNILSALYAASGYLEQMDSPMGRRADAAVTKAIASGRALSSALFLTSLTEADATAIESATSLYVECNVEMVGRLSTTMLEIADIQLLEGAPPSSSSRALKVDFDTLEALLICAVFLQRRETGGEKKLSARLTFACDSEFPHAEFLIEGQWHLEPSSKPSGRSLHPCGIALARVNDLLKVQRISLQDLKPCGLAIRIPLCQSSY
jgi:hypothetical protein